MLQQMHFQAPRSVKLLLTVSARMLRFTVRFDVNRQLVLRFKTFLTRFALEILLVAVSGQMPLQGNLVSEFFVTHVTRVRLLPGVLPAMQVEVVSAFKALQAHLALVRFLMQVLVLAVTASVGKRLVASCAVKSCLLFFRQSFRVC